MGGACCVAARDKNIVTASRSDVLTRNIRHSPSWSFRWENRGRVAGEDVSVSWLSERRSRNDSSDTKFDSTCASEDGSPPESFSRRLHKSPLSERNLVPDRTPASDQSISRNMSMDAFTEPVKDAADSSSKLSVSLPSASSSLASPMFDQNSSHSASMNLKRWHSLTGKISDARMRELRAPSGFPVPLPRPTNPSWNNDSSRGSYAGSSDGWSVQTFAELVTASRSESFSFDAESTNSSSEKTRPSSSALHVCGICRKLLSEKSLWSILKLVPVNELPVVAVLLCGHVYHAECLDTLTPDISKFDPPCPVCIYGEKQTAKLSQKAIKAEMEGKVRNRRLKARVVDGDVDGEVSKGGERDTAFPSRSSSSKPFVKRHFSFGLASQSPKKKGFFWSRSLKA